MSKPFTKPFYQDGPVEVSSADFLEYQRLYPTEHADFDSLARYWLDEHHPDGVRRLALRDLLRQEFSSKSPYAYYQANSSAGRLAVLLRDEKRPEIKNANLLYRPKLVAELTSELLYTVANKRYPQKYNAPSEIDDFVKILIPLVDESDGRLLLRHHSVWSLPVVPVNETLPVLYVIVDDAYPEWLRNTLWDTFKSSCEDAPKLRQDFRKYQRLNDIPGANNVPVRVLQETSRFIGLYSVKDQRTKFAQLIPILQYLNELLPANLEYSADYEAIVIAPQIPDDATAFAYARRHTINANQDTSRNSFDTPAGRRFLYWLRGLAAFLDPTDAALELKIHQLLYPDSVPADDANPA